MPLEGPDLLALEEGSGAYAISVPVDVRAVPLAAAASEGQDGGLAAGSGDDNISIVTEVLSVDALESLGREGSAQELLLAESVPPSEPPEAASAEDADNLAPETSEAAAPQAAAAVAAAGASVEGAGRMSGPLPADPAGGHPASAFPGVVQMAARAIIHLPCGSGGEECSQRGAFSSQAAKKVDLALQFACPICLEVCDEAVETPCCHNLFCLDCLLSESHPLENCPMCKRTLEVHGVAANIPVRRMIAEMPYTCRFDGCGAQLRRRDRSHHEDNCDFMPVRCRHSARCTAGLLRRQLAFHEAEECPFRLVHCPMRCGCTVGFDCLDDHLSRECPRMTLNCERCEAAICRAEMAEHARTHCPLAVVACALPEHETREACSHRCERRYLGEHRKQCEFRPTSCQHEGCLQVTTARQLEAHKEVCQWRMLLCPDCGAETRLGSLQDHLVGVCLEHVVSCPFAAHGCPELMPRRLVEEHLQSASGAHLAQVCAALSLRDLQFEILRDEFARMRGEYERRLAALERPGAGPTPAGRRNRQERAGAVGLPFAAGDRRPQEALLQSPRRAPSPPASPDSPPPPPPPLGRRQPASGGAAAASAAGLQPGAVGHHRGGEPLGPSSRDEHPAAVAAAATDNMANGYYPGPPWDREHPGSPPGALQPQLFLREVAVSQFPTNPARAQGRGGSGGHGGQPAAGTSTASLSDPPSHGEGGRGVGGFGDVGPMGAVMGGRVAGVNFRPMYPHGVGPLHTGGSDSINGLAAGVPMGFRTPRAPAPPAAIPLASVPPPPPTATPHYSLFRPSPSAQSRGAGSVRGGAGSSRQPGAGGGAAASPDRARPSGLTSTPAASTDALLRAGATRPEAHGSPRSQPAGREQQSPPAHGTSTQVLVGGQPAARDTESAPPLAPYATAASAPNVALPLVSAGPVPEPGVGEGNPGAPQPPQELPLASASGAEEESARVTLVLEVATPRQPRLSAVAESDEPLLEF